MAPQLPRLGTFHTSTNRTWSDTDMDDVVVTQSFPTPYTSAPDVLTALNFIDIGITEQTAANTIGIKSSVEDVRSKQLTLRIGVWGDGCMSDNGCDWLAVTPGDTRYRCGTYRVHRRSVLVAPEDHPRAPQDILFDPPFPKNKHPVVVVVWLAGFQMAAVGNWYINVTATYPTRTGFDLNITAPDAALHQAAVSWFAYQSAYPHNIQSGTFEATDINLEKLDYMDSTKKEGEEEFSHAFASIPKVMQGISSVEVDNNTCIIVQVQPPTNITLESFEWKIHGWGQAQTRRLVGSYIAICDP